MITKVATGATNASTDDSSTNNHSSVRTPILPLSPHSIAAETVEEDDSDNDSAYTSTNQSNPSPSINPPAVYPIFQAQSTPAHRVQMNRNEDEFLGDILEDPKPPTWTRFSWENIKGIRKYRQSAELKEIFGEQLRLQSDFRGVIEHKCDTTQHHVRQRFFDQAKGVFGKTKFKVIAGSSSLRANSTAKPGGTMSCSFGNIWGRWKQSGSDPLGRWTFQTFEGKGSRLVTVITAYQPCKPEAKTGFATWHQQEALLRQQRRLVGTPRYHFRHDLQTLIKDLQKQQHEVVLGGDFNEALDDSNSGMLSLAATCDLVDVFSQRFPHQTPPSTHLAGSKRIDFILMSRRLSSCVRRIGYFPFKATTANSDHRGMYVDFDTVQLFGGKHADLSTEEPRGINSRDWQCVRRALHHFDAFATSQNLYERMQNLTERVELDSLAIEAIDRDIGEACRLSNTRCRPRPKPWFSHKLAKARLKVNGLDRLHSALKEKSTGIKKITVDSIVDSLENYGIALPTVESVHDIRRELAAAQADLLFLEENSRKTRTDEQQSAIDTAAKSGKKDRKTILRTIRQNEKTRQMFTTFRAIRKANASSSVTKLEIPDDWPSPNTPIEHVQQLSDPKSASKWRTVSTTDEIEYYLQLRNRLHFGQAEGTPLTVAPLSHVLSWPADNEAAQQILEGRFDFDTLEEVDDVTKLMLRKCKAVSPLNFIPSELTMEDFLGKIKVWAEHTTTSPSGRHLGNYKILTARHSPHGEDPEYEFYASLQNRIASLHLQVLNYCTGRKYVLNQWKDVTNVMIFKEPGNFKIHRLRVIHIYEADYNLLLSVKYRRLLLHADQLHLTHRGQHGGRPGHDATTLTLLEELKNDISYAARRILLNFDNDAASCYDRIIVALASLVSRRFGQNAHVVWVNASTLEEARFRLKTALGVSARHYSHCIAFPLHGTGQGSSNSPVIWCFISSVLLEVHEELAHGATFHSPDGSITVHFSMVGFVDDSTSQTNDFLSDPQPSVSVLSVAAQRDAQLWNDLLWSSGGLLELVKCSYHILSFQFDSTGCPHPVGGIPPDPILLRDSTTGNEVPIPAKSAFDPHKTLGHFKAPAGNNHTQLHKIIEKGRKLAGLLATPQSKENWLAASTTLSLPRPYNILYPRVSFLLTN